MIWRITLMGGPLDGQVITVRARAWANLPVRINAANDDGSVNANYDRPAGPDTTAERQRPRDGEEVYTYAP